MAIPMRAILLLLPLAACATGPLPPSVRLPGDFVSGGSDSMRSAILDSAYVFNRESSAAARARATAMVEFLAADYRWDHRWAEYTPLAGAALTAARDELHAAYGIAPQAEPQRVADLMFGIARALTSGREPFLPPEVFTASTETLARLNAPADLPATRNATGLIERELHRIDTERFSGGGPGGQGGSGGAHP